MVVKMKMTFFTKYNVYKFSFYCSQQKHCIITIIFLLRVEELPLTPKTKAKKRKIAETSNVITETLPSVEGEQVKQISKLSLFCIHK